jgi:beta-glucanase (GH16 family)
MKRFLVLFFLPLSTLADVWRLVWSDDFNRAGAPDSKKWTYEKGFVRNQELQLYTDSRNNVRVEGGCLVLEARRETVRNPAFKEGAKDWQRSRANAEYTSASIRTRGLQAFSYGKIEMRAKLPAGKGIWPAFWMLGNNKKGSPGWPACGEIDIMEFVSHDPGMVYGTIHFPKSGGPKPSQQISGSTKSDSLHRDFHVYGVDWNEKVITFLFDGKPYKTIALDAAGTGPGNPFRKRDAFYLILNLAVGGSWGGQPDPKVYPQKYEIDWVKAWEK